ncbi:MAG TPA: hypothetical protein VFB60_15410 [Ktedonobacteraceae bacterium]|nr:hypothetical protein [Ktedonobacteraceae bacterium]
MPLWIDHSIGNLLLNDGLTHAHLGLYREAVDSFDQIQGDYANDVTTPLTCRVEALIEQITVEVSRDDQPRDMEMLLVGSGAARCSPALSEPHIAHDSDLTLFLSQVTCVVNLPISA